MKIILYCHRVNGQRQGYTMPESYIVPTTCIKMKNNNNNNACFSTKLNDSHN